MEWFDKNHNIIPINRHDIRFCLQYMNGRQGTKQSGIQWNILLEAVVTVMKYKKITIDNAIYIKIFSDKTVS